MPLPYICQLCLYRHCLLLSLRWDDTLPYYSQSWIHKTDLFLWILKYTPFSGMKSWKASATTVNMPVIHLLETAGINHGYMSCVWAPCKYHPKCLQNILQWFDPCKAIFHITD